MYLYNYKNNYVTIRIGISFITHTIIKHEYIQS